MYDDDDDQLRGDSDILQAPPVDRPVEQKHNPRRRRSPSPHAGPAALADLVTPILEPVPVNPDDYDCVAERNALFARVAECKRNRVVGRVGEQNVDPDYCYLCPLKIESDNTHDGIQPPNVKMINFARANWNMGERRMGEALERFYNRYVKDVDPTTQGRDQPACVLVYHMKFELNDDEIYLAGALKHCVYTAHVLQRSSGLKHPDGRIVVNPEISVALTRNQASAKSILTLRTQLRAAAKTKGK